MLALADDPFASEPSYDHPEAVEAVRVDYQQAADKLWRVMFDHGKGDVTYYDHVCSAWCYAHGMVVALDWLLFGELPFFRSGEPKAPWVTEVFAGPWPEVGR